MRLAPFAAIALLVGTAQVCRADLAILGTFDPSQAGGLCGLAFDHTADEAWVYQCSATTLQRYSSPGAFQSSIARPGEAANDVDLETAPEALTLGATPIADGSLLLVNGETGPAEIYAVDEVSGAVTATLNTAFGASHVVGGAYHRQRDTFFLLQDRVPAGANSNRIAEVDAASGNVLGSFQISATFDVNFGDVEVCDPNGNLLVVSSLESRIAEYTPAGAHVAYHALPVGVTGLSAIGIDEATGDIWVASTTGVVWQLGGGPCTAAPQVPLLPGVASSVLASLLLVGARPVRHTRRA